MGVATSPKSTSLKPVLRSRLKPACISLGFLLTGGATAQEFPDVQRLTNTALYADQDIAARRRQAERDELERLARRSAEQAALLDQQSASVRQLAGELQQVRDERAIIEAAAAFDAALAVRHFDLVRPLVADAITFDLPGRAGTMVPAERFIAALSALAPLGSVSPRNGQRLRLDDERGTLLSQGYGWGRATASQAGEYEYGFRRSVGGWRLDTLLFRPASPHP